MNASTELLSEWPGQNPVHRVSQGLEKLQILAVRRGHRDWLGSLN
jgi:hypothetical protein